MKIPRLIVGMLALVASLHAYCDIAVGPGKYSSFATDDGNAVVVGVSGLSWSDFNAKDSYGTTCFVHDSIVDAEKTAADNDDDYWCGPITDMNLLYITGWARKTSYATVDDMVDYFRSNVKLLRYAKTPGNIDTVTEGTYGYDGLFRWFKATTKQDLASFAKTGQGVTALVLGNLMDKGEYALHVDVLFDDSNTNPKWGGMWVSHAVTCCGYETDATGNLTGLFIIDSDNDQYGDANGGRAAPNSILYCPVTWNADQGMYAVGGIWGETSYLMPGYTALRMYQGEPKAVKLDANGGKVTPATINVVEDGTYGELPEPTKTGGEFEGWWTAKEGGVQVQEGDPVDFSIFASPKTPTLYAQWRKACKITVAGGYIYADDGSYPTSLSGLFRGDEVHVDADLDKSYDKDGNFINAFANWTYTPATADLGEGFDPFSSEGYVSMPNADVKLTANFVNGFAAYVFPDYYKQGEVGEEGEFYWSVDNGKTLIPFGTEFPVKAGKVTVKFFDKKGIWRAADVTLTVDKRGTYKEGTVTRYEDPQYYCPNAKFVPVNNSTTVKLDANGGSGPSVAFFANECEYGCLDIPYRKGYVFAGWWTAKDGGEHITSDKIFDPADFAGQKTPTLYAHWLKMQKLTLKDDSAWASWSLNEEDFDPELYDEIMNGLFDSIPDFEGGGYLEGKGVMEVLPGARVSVSVDGYSYDKNWNELVFQKWTITPSKADFGPYFQVSCPSTDIIMPSEDVTLQATYIDEWTCGDVYASAYASSIYLGDDDETGESVMIEPPYAAFEWSPDGGKTWYKTDYFENEEGCVLLKNGSYTVTWRSTDPSWAVVYAKTKITLASGSSDSVWAQFSYNPQVVVDVMTVNGDGECALSPAGGTATMSSKDGLVYDGKPITLTAKAAKDYVFQGWALKKGWNYGDAFRETAASWKLERWLDDEEDCGLTDFIDPDDRKVHVVAVFKALSAYSAADIAFSGFTFGRGGSYAVDGDVVNVRAVAGCAVNDSLCSAPAASPLSYKLAGKLPDGLKFDAKTGVLSGVPKKAGKATVTITASDPAKNSKDLTVMISVAELPSWLEGEYRGIMSESQQNGILELSVKSDGKVSAKVLTRYGSRSVSGTLEWRDPEASYVDNDDDDDDEEEDEEDVVSEFRFWHTDAKDDSYCHVNFREDGTIDGEVDSYDKKEESYAGGDMTGLRQDKDLLPDSDFLDKYYTFAFCAESPAQQSDDDDDDDDDDSLPAESEMASGYGYLTLKTDKTGGVKVAGQLPDGEKVSMSALVMPCLINGDDEATTDNIAARLYLFASPSAYKKLGWFAMQLMLMPDGYVMSEEGAAWTTSAGGASGGGVCSPYYMEQPQVNVFGEGALYSEAATLENYYWNVCCAWSEEVRQQYSWKESGYSYSGGDGGGAQGLSSSYTAYDDAPAQNFDDYFFNVAVMGDKKGAISLVEKSPAPWEESWKEDGVTYKEWNYWEDKKGNPITDPSQLSISFTKATGIFTGKATVYFDYWQPNYKKDRYGDYYDAGSDQHKTASLPYAGVMIASENDEGKKEYMGLGAAIHTYKHSYEDENGKTKTETEKISLPVSLESSQADDEEPQDDDEEP